MIAHSFNAGVRERDMDHLAYLMYSACRKGVAARTRCEIPGVGIVWQTIDLS